MRKLDPDTLKTLSGGGKDYGHDKGGDKGHGGGKSKGKS